MLSAKKSVLQTIALLKAYEVKHIVISPGSRNAPLIQTFTEDVYFDCHIIVDERNAAFYALGIIQSTQKPVVVCCTSGSALLNFAPAVSEAYYQQLPLIVVSADRSAEWIGQMDGQTIPQVGAFGSLSKKSVQLPECKDDTEMWHCNRLINEVLIACTANQKGPVHINIPLSEPLFDYSVKQLPDVRKIRYQQPHKTIDIENYAARWNSFSKKMIVVGQLPHSNELTPILEKFAAKTDCVIVTESLSNCTLPNFICNGDALLSTISEDNKNDFAPDLVISLGGHIVSKRLKHFLRQNKPKEHWLILDTENVVDLFQSLTDIVETDASSFLSEITSSVKRDKGKNFYTTWKNLSNKIEEPTGIPFSDISATDKFLKKLPRNASLHLANSSTVRNAELFHLDSSIRVFCNRGTNGIESTLPSTIGFSSVHEGITYLIIGDLSFFYGVNALWNMQHIKNLRILLINNGGGGIFHLLPNLKDASSLKRYVAAEHDNNAENWAKAGGLTYLSAKNDEELDTSLKIFMNEKSNKSIVLEVITDMETNKKVFGDYYNKLKTII